MRVIKIIFAVMLISSLLTATALATVTEDNTTASYSTSQSNTESATEEGETAQADPSPGGSSFRLEWYHYIIPAVLIFAMTAFTSHSIRPNGKQ